MMTGGLVLAAGTTKAEPVQAVAAATQTKAKMAQTNPAQQTYSLDLDTTKYEKKTMTVDGKKVAFRAYENRVYVAHPIEIYMSLKDTLKERRLMAIWRRQPRFSCPIRSAVICQGHRASRLKRIG